MARLFDDASTEGLYNDTPPVVDIPIMFSCWFYTDDGSSTQALVADCKYSGPYLYHTLRLYNGYVSMVSRGSTLSEVQALSTIQYTTNTWHHACGYAQSTTSRGVYLDGGNKGTNGVARPTSTSERLSIGYQGSSTPHSYLSGSVAEVGEWNVILTDDEVYALSRGYPPIYVRPENLTFYLPCIRDVDNDLINGLYMSKVGTPEISPHPGVFYPKK